MLKLKMTSMTKIDVCKWRTGNTEIIEITYLESSSPCQSSGILPMTAALQFWYSSPKSRTHSLILFLRIVKCIENSHSSNNDSLYDRHIFYSIKKNDNMIINVCSKISVSSDIFIICNLNIWSFFTIFFSDCRRQRRRT